MKIKTLLVSLISLIVILSIGFNIYVLVHGFKIEEHNHNDMRVFSDQRQFQQQSQLTMNIINSYQNIKGKDKTLTFTFNSDKELYTFVSSLDINEYLFAKITDNIYGSGYLVYLRVFGEEQSNKFMTMYKETVNANNKD